MSDEQPKQLPENDSFLLDFRKTHYFNCRKRHCLTIFGTDFLLFDWIDGHTMSHNVTQTIASLPSFRWWQNEEVWVLWMKVSKFCFSFKIVCVFSPAKSAVQTSAFKRITNQFDQCGLLCWASLKKKGKPVAQALGKRQRTRPLFSSMLSSNALLESVYWLAGKRLIAVAQSDDLMGSDSYLIAFN